MTPEQVASLLRRVADQPGLVARFNSRVTSPPTKALRVWADEGYAVEDPLIPDSEVAVLSMPCVVTVANSDDLYDRMLGLYEASREDAVLDAVDGEGRQ